MPIEAELVSLVFDKGLAVGIAVFLVWFVTQQISKVLNAIADKLNAHDVQAKSILDKVCAIEAKVDKVLEK